MSTSELIEQFDLTWEQIGHLSEMPQSIRNIKEFVEYYMGTRCPKCEPECPACKAWNAVDHLDRLVQEMTDEFITNEIKK